MAAVVKALKINTDRFQRRGAKGAEQTIKMFGINTQGELRPPFKNLAANNARNAKDFYIKTTSAPFALFAAKLNNTFAFRALRSVKSGPSIYKLNTQNQH
jgi:hypothetical protein